MDPITQQAISYMFELALATFVPVIVHAAFVMVRQVIPAVGQWTKAHVSEKQWAQLESVASLAVNYAEQVAASQDVQNASEYKLGEATGRVQSFIDRKGWGKVFSAQDVRMVIEAAVRKEFNSEPEDSKGPEPEPTTPPATTSA